MSSRIRSIPRRALAAAPTVVPLVGLLVARAVWGERLPETIAVHWSGTTPDRFGSPLAYFWGALTVGLLATCIAGVVAVRPDTDDRLWLPATAMVSWTVSATWITTVALTMSADTPENARIGPWIVVPLLGVLWALVAFALAPATPPHPIGTTATLDTPLSPTERAAWTGRTHGRWVAVLAFAMAFGAVASLLMGEWWIALLFTVLVLVAGAFSSITVQVDRRGLGISSWGVRWKRVPLDAIDSATATTIHPVHWGGWGYRFTPRGTAVVIRGGDGIVVTKKNGRPFAVTVDSAENGAALLNSLVAARSPA